MKIKKRNLYWITATFILVGILAIILMHQYRKDPYNFQGYKFSYSEYRGKPEYELKLMNTTQNLEIYKAIYKSKDFLSYPTKIYGLLFLPLHQGNIPGIVLLPGGGVTKESESVLALKLATRGYAVLTIDQRGIGETGGVYLGIEQDYQIFLRGKEPIQHLSVYDALVAYDVLKSVETIDKNNIIIAGESMGGRYAIIAGAIEKRFKGVLIISSSGFHIPQEKNQEMSYLLSIDPDQYITDISPRELIMIHGNNDTTVKLNDAKLTFSLAKEPKEFYLAEGCGHGYCPKMDRLLDEGIKRILNK